MFDTEMGLGRLGINNRYELNVAKEGSAVAALGTGRSGSSNKLDGLTESVHLRRTYWSRMPLKHVKQQGLVVRWVDTISKLQLGQTSSEPTMPVKYQRRESEQRSASPVSNSSWLSRKQSQRVHSATRLAKCNPGPDARKTRRPNPKSHSPLVSFHESIRPAEARSCLPHRGQVGPDVAARKKAPTLPEELLLQE